MARDQNTYTVLVTGGAGYVGSHSVLCLLEHNYRVVVVDNCSNAHMNPNIDSNGNIEHLPESLKRVEELANKKLTAFYELNLVSDLQQLDHVFRRHHIKAVIHYAALKSVNESIGLPLEYYTNNLVGTINLLNTMRNFGCKRLIFSSSATVYGLPEYLPVDEKHQVGVNVLNPYGRTKCMIEQILRDLCAASEPGSTGSAGSAALPSSTTSDQTHTNNGHKCPIAVQQPSSKWHIISLRYFNPVGAHPSGYIGEHTQGAPNNLMPYISQVSIGKRDKLHIFGADFDTPDGTGVRDYIHIMDLARGHVHALDNLLNTQHNQQHQLHAENTYRAYNLGTGKGYSVLETVRTFEAVNNVRVPYEIAQRRPGDAGCVYADAALARSELNWTAKHSLVEMVRDTYKWQSLYPDGFKSSSKRESGA